MTYTGAHVFWSSCMMIIGWCCVNVRDGTIARVTQDYLQLLPLLYNSYYCYFFSLSTLHTVFMYSIKIPHPCNRLCLLLYICHVAHCCDMWT